MDWTIVISVLVALLLWVLALVLIAAAVVMTAFTVLRGRTERVAGRMMETCQEHFRAMVEPADDKRAEPLPANRRSVNPGSPGVPC